MSWAQWSAATQPPSVAPTAAVPSVLNPSGSAINPAPAVMPPGMQYTPEQWAQLQQQNWNQWAQWQQQYQQWHQQYGAEVMNILLSFFLYFVFYESWKHLWFLNKIV